MVEVCAMVNTGMTRLWLPFTLIFDLDNYFSILTQHPPCEKYRVAT